ncbi:cysteine hydrolase family protein [Photobacterium indicum]|uniref:Cysteine hydrolase n=1 Tax=Photobacterium indicum TaxID=81447 RepID=A0A2T3L4F0_9GAMM|nr:cysteine hydrolase family protein [Photobacterium indicum]PSV44380.1 cysteine hydrolase [Photobacterium indicum]
MNKKALLVIDLQNDYFPKGKFPLWNTELTLSNIKAAIEKANAQNIAVIHIKHEAAPEKGIAPFFNQGSEGVEIHPEIMAVAPNSEVIVKTYADSFEQTNLEEALQKQGIEELLICGMMTQNCVTHTAISKAAEKYSVSVLMDCCTTVDEIIHKIALNAVSTRIPLVTTNQVF